MASGADLSRIELVSMVQDKGKDRMFSLVTDLPLLRQKINEVGDVRMVQIDPISAYRVRKVDSFRTTRAARRSREPIGAGVGGNLMPPV
jgi:hypothetical protein